MADLTDYCTPDSVRAVLGISAEEIEDVTVLDPIYYARMIEDLNKLNPGLIGTYTAAKAASPQSATQERFVLLVQTAAAYLVAQQMLAALPMFAPQTIQDSKSQVSRVVNPYTALTNSILGSLNYFYGVIQDVYVLLNPGSVAPDTTVRIVMLTTGVALDPVTGV